MRFAAPLLALALLLAPAAQAETFRGMVSHVTDGDTVWVRPARGGRSVELRLLDLDAPEGCQAFGPQARKALADRILRQPVKVRTRGFDVYGRHLARIEFRGQDVGAWLVRQGYAWSMTFHGKAGAYAKLEQKARRESRGLWALPGAADPRSFRKRFGRCP